MAEKHTKDEYTDIMVGIFESGIHGRFIPMKPHLSDRCFICGKQLLTPFGNVLMEDGSKVQFKNATLDKPTRIAANRYNDKRRMLNLYCKDHQYMYWEDRKKMEEAPPSQYVWLASEILKMWMKAYSDSLSLCWREYWHETPMRYSVLQEVGRFEKEILYGTDTNPRWFEVLSMGYVDPRVVICRKRRIMAQRKLRKMRAMEDGKAEAEEASDTDSDS